MMCGQPFPRNSNLNGSLPLALLYISMTFVETIAACPSVPNPQIRADLYTEGDYILHLDSDVLVLHEVTYQDIFHFGKPVLPYRRHRDDSREGGRLPWANIHPTFNALSPFTNIYLPSASSNLIALFFCYRLRESTTALKDL